MSDLAPLVQAEVDLRGMSSFMLDVDRLLASELVALGTPEECWAATMLWCRAWKQVPAASLPDDDRVLAAFSGAGRRWPKIREMALRGFVKCSDGRLYHKVLSEEANAAWKRRIAHHEKRERDADRLRSWRATKQEGNGADTRFVAERDRDRDETGTKKEKKDAGTSPAPVTQEAELFARGKDVLGKDAGGLIRRLLNAKNNNVSLARAAIEQASTKQDPREYIGAIIKGKDPPPSEQRWDARL